MKKDIIDDNLDKIKQKYESTVYYNGRCWIDNEIKYYQFLWLLKEMDLDTKFEKLKKKLENEQTNISENKRILNKRILDQLIFEYNNIISNAQDKFDFSDKLIRELDKNYIKNYEKNGAHAIYRNLCKDIIDSAVSYYIKCEKSLILLVDKFNSINLWEL